MRIAVGILMIILGVVSMIVPTAIAGLIAGIQAGSLAEHLSMMDDMASWYLPMGFVLLAAIAGGGICTLRGKAWWWAFLGSILLPLVSMAFVTVVTIQGLIRVSLPSSSYIVEAALGGVTILVITGMPIIVLLWKRGEFAS